MDELTESKAQLCRRRKESYQTHALVDRGDRAHARVQQESGISQGFHRNMAASPLRTVRMTGCEDGYTGGRNASEAHGIVS